MIDLSNNRGKVQIALLATIAGAVTLALVSEHQRAAEATYLAEVEAPVAKYTEGQYAKAVNEDISFRSPADASCPQTEEEWLDFLGDQSRSFARNGRLPYSRIHRQLRNCESEIESAGLQSCVQNLKNFARVNSLSTGQRTDRVFGFEMTDDDYMASAPTEAWSLPTELADGIPTDWRRLKGTQNPDGTYSFTASGGGEWTVLNYRSRTVGNPGNPPSYNRLLFVRKGDTYDKYIQFTLPDRMFRGGQFDPTGFDVRASNVAQQRSEALVDFISIRKTDLESGEALDNPVIKFRQFYRDRNGGNPRDRLQAQNFVDTCYSCHPSGMRRLSPMPGSVGPEQWQTLNEINRLMDSYGRIDWEGSITTSAYGAPMGEEVGCVRCHNNNQYDDTSLPPIHPLHHESGHVQHKMLVDLTMPVTRMDRWNNVVKLVRVVDQFKDEYRVPLLERFGSGGNPNPQQLVRELNRIGFFSSNFADFYDARIPESQRLINEALNLSDVENWLAELMEQRQLYYRLLNPRGQRYRAQTARWLTESCPTPEDAE